MTEVSVTKASLTMPLLRYLRTSFLAGDEGDGMDGAPFAVPAGVLDEREVAARPPRQQRG